MATDTRESLSEHARAILLAEALGDLQNLAVKLGEFDARLDALAKRMDTGARHDWVALLDSKMREFQFFQIPELAAHKLQAHSETFLRGLMADVKQLVALEVRQQYKKHQVFLMLGVFIAGMLVATTLHALFAR
jgi:hypothetical protein